MAAAARAVALSFPDFQLLSARLRPRERPRPSRRRSSFFGREGQDAGFSWSDFLLPKNELLADIDRFL